MTIEKYLFGLYDLQNIGLHLAFSIGPQAKGDCLKSSLLNLKKYMKVHFSELIVMQSNAV